MVEATDNKAATVDVEIYHFKSGEVCGRIVSEFFFAGILEKK